MAILIGNHEFDGPISSLTEIPKAAGLYAILYKQNRDYLLVDIDQSENLAKALKDPFRQLTDKMIVFLPCDSGDKRRDILHELLREFEFEPDDLGQAAASKRTETKSGFALSIC